MYLCFALFIFSQFWHLVFCHICRFSILTSGVLSLLSQLWALGTLQRQSFNVLFGRHGSSTSSLLMLSTWLFSACHFGFISVENISIFWKLESELWVKRSILLQKLSFCQIKYTIPGFVVNHSFPSHCLDQNVEQLVFCKIWVRSHWIRSFVRRR